MKTTTKLFLVIAAIVASGNFVNASALADPSSAAPTPPARSAAKVISVFSDAYANGAGASNFNPWWWQATVVTTIQIGSDNVLKYATLNYQGTEFGSDVNAVAMTHLHVDAYTADETVLKVTCISRSTGERFVAATPINLNAWNSYDIPLTDFTSQGLSVADLFQFKFEGSGGKTVYLDNLYFYDNSATVDSEAPTAFTASKGAVTYESVELLLKASDNSGAVKFDITYGATTVSTTGVSGVEKSLIITGLNADTDYSFSIVAKDATGNLAANNPLVVSAKTVVGLAVPDVAAPTPTVAADKVISIFSDAYTNVAATDFNPNWGQATVVSTIQVAGNNTLKYNNLTYQGTQFGSTVDASALTTLHLDVWTPNETELKVTPIGGGELLLNLAPLNLNVWNSFDIPLASFTGVNKSAMIQIKFDCSRSGKVVYLDNIYFYQATLTESANLKMMEGLSIYPSKVISNLNLASKVEMKELIISNLLGQSVRVIQLNSLEKSIEMGNVPAGTYMVTVKLANGQSATQKIVKL